VEELKVSEMLRQSDREREEGGRAYTSGRDASRRIVGVGRHAGQHTTVSRVNKRIREERIKQQL